MKVVKKGEKPEVEVKEGQAKMPYDQLENIAHQLSEQVQVWMKRAKDNEVGAAFQRLNYLFKVVGTPNKNQVFSIEFVERCAKEIEEMMFQSEQELEKEVEEESKN